MSTSRGIVKALLMCGGCRYSNRHSWHQEQQQATMQQGAMRVGIIMVINALLPGMPPAAC